MLVIVNLRANDGRAHAAWSSVRRALRARCGAFDECVESDIDRVRAVVVHALGRGERRFVAAGGDGTVNLLLSILAEALPASELARVTLGAVGLGSSNDFHKPVHDTIEGHPCRLDFAHSIRHDIGRCALTDRHGRTLVGRWLINASIGTTATGNMLYNHASGVVGWLKRRSASLGMVGAACQALLAWRGPLMRLEDENGRRLMARVRNLGVVKNPHFTGALCYDSTYEPGSGDFNVHLLADNTLWDTIITLWRLAHGKFGGRQSARSWRARFLSVDSSTPFPVERDGEVVWATRVDFGLESAQLMVCP